MSDGRQWEPEPLERVWRTLLDWAYAVLMAVVPCMWYRHEGIRGWIWIEVYAGRYGNGERLAGRDTRGPMTIGQWGLDGDF